MISFNLHFSPDSRIAKNPRDRNFLTMTCRKSTKRNTAGIAPAVSRIQLKAHCGRSCRPYDYSNRYEHYTKRTEQTRSTRPSCSTASKLAASCTSAGGSRGVGHAPPIYSDQRRGGAPLLAVSLTHYPTMSCFASSAVWY